MSFDNWEPPESIEEGANELIEIIGEIQVIQAQLGDRSRRQHTNYYEWRKKAIVSLTNKLDELRRLKGWLHTQRDTLEEVLR